MTRALAIIGVIWIAVTLERHRQFWASARLH